MIKVLVIDDDPIVQLILSRALRKQGYEVSMASNGQEGLLKARQLQPALVICDWMMPVMDGLQVCRQIKSDPKLLTTFFILVTARGAVEDRVRGLDTGADDFLSKPIELVELWARVRAGLRLHQVNQALQDQKQILEAELSEAADYVRSLLPHPLKGEVEIDTRFIPSKQLGGDCFDFYWLNPDELVFYLLDVSGHGVGSALLSVSVLNLLRSRGLQAVSFTSPASVLTALNDTFQMSQHKDLYFTIWYGVYHRQSRELVYASAGHPPAVFTTPQQTVSLKTIGPPIGMLSDIQFFEDVFRIPGPGSLYVFSDGIYEINQSDGHVWGLKAFTELLAQQAVCQGSNLKQILYRLRTVGNQTSFGDDISILQINFPGSLPSLG